jgi:hypothetical protein
MLVQKAIDTDGAGLSWSYFISWLDNGHIVAGVYYDEDLAVADPNNSAFNFYAPVRLQSTDMFGDKVPIFIALTVVGPDVTLYVNGGVQDTFNPVTELGFDPATSVAYGAGPMVMGANWVAGRGVGYPRNLDGIIDEVEVFDKALTQAELQAIQTGGKCKTSNEPPVVDPVTGGPVEEGSTFETSVSFADDDSDSWTALVDYGDGTVKSAPVTGTSVGLSHVYVQEGNYLVTVTVTDDGPAERSNSGSVVVNNVAPTVDAGLDAKVFEGSLFKSSGSFTDPGAADSWSATVDYGDGSGIHPLALSGMNVDLSHTYTTHQCSPFVVTVTVTDNGGGEGSDHAQVTVNYEYELSGRQGQREARS